MGFSAIVSPHNGAAFREGHGGAAKVARGRGCAEGSLLELLSRGYRLPLHSPALEARPGEELAGRKDFLPFVGSFCAIFVLQDSFCCPR